MRKKILVIEDDSLIKTALKKLLEKDYDVITKSNGKEGIELLTKEFNLVITDVYLLHNIGYDILKKCNEINLPCIIISIINDEKFISEMLKLGASDYITRPLSYLELNSRVKKHIL